MGDPLDPGEMAAASTTPITSPRPSSRSAPSGRDRGPHQQGTRDDPKAAYEKVGDARDLPVPRKAGSSLQTNYLNVLFQRRSFDKNGSQAQAQVIRSAAGRLALGLHVHGGFDASAHPVRGTSRRLARA